MIERSDLDIYHIMRGNKWSFVHWDIIRDAVGDIIDVYVLVDSVKSLVKYVNMLRDRVLGDKRRYCGV